MLDPALVNSFASSTTMASDLKPIIISFFVGIVTIQFAIPLAKAAASMATNLTLNAFYRKPKPDKKN